MGRKMLEGRSLMLSAEYAKAQEALGSANDDHAFSQFSRRDNPLWEVCCDLLDTLPMVRTHFRLNRSSTPKQLTGILCCKCHLLPARLLAGLDCDPTADFVQSAVQLQQAPLRREVFRRDHQPRQENIRIS